MVDFSIWDIFRNLLLAARWTVLLSMLLRQVLRSLGWWLFPKKVAR